MGTVLHDGILIASTAVVWVACGRVVLALAGQRAGVRS